MPAKTRVNGKIVGIKVFTSSSRKTETEVSILTLLQNAHGNIGRREKFSNNQTWMKGMDILPVMSCIKLLENYSMEIRKI
jgi:hypothetical protein